MSDDKPWSPTLDNPKVFQDHKNPAVSDRDPPLRVPDPEEDTAPLQGSKDLSDTDSLEDVIAESYEPSGATPPTPPQIPPRSREGY